MPELVVDGLELVHVDKQQADWPARPAAECLGVFAEEAPAVQQAGKRIAFGKFGQGLADLHRPIALHPQGAQPSPEEEDAEPEESVAIEFEAVEQSAPDRPQDLGLGRGAPAAQGGDLPVERRVREEVQAGAAVPRGGGGGG